MPSAKYANRLGRRKRHYEVDGATTESSSAIAQPANLITRSVQQVAQNPDALSQENVLQLQRLIGNRAVTRLIREKQANTQAGPNLVQRLAIPTGKKPLAELKKKIKRKWDDVAEDEDSDDAATLIAWAKPAAAKATNILELMLEIYESFSDWESKIGKLKATELLVDGEVSSKENTIILIRDLKALSERPAAPAEPQESESDFQERADAYFGLGELPEALMDKVTPHVVVGYFNPTAKTNKYFKQLLSHQSIIAAAYKGKVLIKQWKDKAKTAQEEIDKVLLEIKGEAASAKAKKERHSKIDGVATLAKPHLDSAPNGTDPLVALVWQASISAGKANGYIELPDGPFTPAVIGRAVHAWRVFKNNWEADTTNYPKGKVILKAPHVPGGTDYIEDKGVKTNVQGVSRSYQTDFIATWLGTKIVVHVNATGPII